VKVSFRIYKIVGDAGRKMQGVQEETAFHFISLWRNIIQIWLLLPAPPYLLLSPP